MPEATMGLSSGLRPGRRTNHYPDRDPCYLYPCTSLCVKEEKRDEEVEESMIKSGKVIDLVWLMPVGTTNYI